MRTTISFCGVLVLALLVVGCDSEDPAQIEQQTVTISINANRGTSDTYNVWNMILDNDSNGQPDDGNVYLWCESLAPGDTQTLNPITIPWTFSTQIDLIPSGTTTKAQVSSSDAVSDTYNVANYDTLVSLATQNSKPPVTSPSGDRYLFLAPRKQPSVNQSIMFATDNPLAAETGNLFGETCPSTNPSPKRRCGLCTRANSGLPRIDGRDTGGGVQCTSDYPQQCQMPWTAVINKGDTLVFQSRIANEAQINVGLIGIVNENPTSLSATVQVDGRTVLLRGVSNGPALSFSYTSR